MSTLSRTLAVPLALFACSGPSKEPVRPVAAPPASSPVAATDVDEPAAPAPECRGASLDLGALAQTGRCDVGGTAAALPRSIEVALASERLEAISGDPAAAAVTLSNRGPAAAWITLDASCGFRNLAEVRFESPGGVRLDRVGVEACSEPRRACAGHVVGVWLEPGGIATIPVRFAARVSVADSRTCESHTGRALSAGRYRALIDTPLTGAPLVAPLVVTEAPTLPVARCGRYADALAAKAEPDPNRRAAVSAAVLHQCRQQPPRMSLVNCQRRAGTEAELAACRPADR